MNLFVVAIGFCIMPIISQAGEQEDSTTCANPEQALIRLISGGEDVTSTATIIGGDNPCDSFGGHKILTPKYEIPVYVNFSIPGSLDLDIIESAYEAGALEQNPNLNEVTIAFVTKEWMVRVYGEEMASRGALLNFVRTILFIRSDLIGSVEFKNLIHEFYEVQAAR